LNTAILVRHAESEFSVRAAVSSDPAVAVGLTAAGEEQAHRLGRSLAREQIDVCVVTEFERTRRTAELALEGRDVPIVVVAELNDPRAGRFEGGPLDEFREWSWAHGSGDEPPGGGESRRALASRLARGYRRVLDRPESTVLVVGHALPMAYVLGDPTPRIDMLDYVTPHRLRREELEAGVERLEAWAAAPTW
jgi:ribonuclease H / adenosylcobalamin/alpha-ribazole phosphatase